MPPIPALLSVNDFLSVSGSQALVAWGGGVGGGRVQAGCGGWGALRMGQEMEISIHLPSP